MHDLILYTYYRSSAAYRVRIALNLKGLAYESRYIHLLKQGGENFSDAYRAINPQAMVPSLMHNDHTITQSLAICEYLEECYPEPRLLPENALERARVRALCDIVACDIHPLNNLRVLNYLKSLEIHNDQQSRWYRHWILEGFDAMEKILAKTAGKFCVADKPTLADCFLVPQVYNAHRYECNLDPYPNINKISSYCLELEAFQRASPEQQADAAS